MLRECLAFSIDTEKALTRADKASGETEAGTFFPIEENDGKTRNDTQVY